MAAHIFPTKRICLCACVKANSSLLFATVFVILLFPDIDLLVHTHLRATCGIEVFYASGLVTWLGWGRSANERGNQVWSLRVWGRLDDWDLSGKSVIRRVLSRAQCFPVISGCSMGLHLVRCSEIVLDIDHAVLPWRFLSKLLRQKRALNLLFIGYLYRLIFFYGICVRFIKFRPTFR